MVMTTNPMTRRNHPRVRGEESLGKWNRKEDHGITPACAGKSGTARTAPVMPMESPPRARGRAFCMYLHALSMRNHPRVRGEEAAVDRWIAYIMESPPRARGRGVVADGRVGDGGITPACAGKRLRLRWTPLRSGNHPRVRGEELDASPLAAPHLESPPRARGRAHVRRVLALLGGITPACAGKRVHGVLSRKEKRNHPRVRGEESNENAAFEGMDIPPKCKFFVLFRNVLRVPCDSRARGSKAIRLSSIRACYMLCVPNTRADHRVFHGGALFVSDIPVIAKWN